MKAIHFVGAALVVALVFGVGVMGCSSYTKRHTVTTTVNDKERVCSNSNDGHQDCKYLVYTDDGTFAITDSLIIGRFDSSDIYGQVKRNRKYRITYYGWRFGCTSSYPNIDHLESEAS
jgi:hypothetical protein